MASMPSGVRISPPAGRTSSWSSISPTRRSSSAGSTAPIPNRGLAMPDINMFGVTYLQQINRSRQPGSGAAHRAGIWANVPQTSDPSEPPTVVRMSSIPHGTVILFQGAYGRRSRADRSTFPTTTSIPFFFGEPAPASSDFHSVTQGFPEAVLSIPTPFRSTASGVTQAIVMNPNSVIQEALQASPPGHQHEEQDFPQCLLHQPADQRWGAGTASTAFAASSHQPRKGRARAAHVEPPSGSGTIAVPAAIPTFSNSNTPSW